MTWEVRQGDCRALMADHEPASIDAIVTDPPYGLSFMGKEWDHGVPGVPFWAEALRVLKPGGHLVAFGGTRTYHRLTCAIEDAGFEVRDCLMWLYGSGFPKSLDVSKAIDKAAGAERVVIGTKHGLPGYSLTDGAPGGVAMEGNVDGSLRNGAEECAITAPATDAARQWEGWGTALKPAWEPIILARKPLSGTVAANVQEHGTGGLNIDGCRISASDKAKFPAGIVSRTEAVYGNGEGRYAERARGEDGNPSGRWPANLVLDEEAAALLDEQSGTLTSGSRQAGEYGRLGFQGWDKGPMPGVDGDSGGASRFFYTAKASSGERHYAGKNAHPTVKPVDLMRWLCRLVAPKGGLVLDPFMGSGSTGIAALAEGFRFLGFELDPEHCRVARDRIGGRLFAEVQ